MTRLVMYTPIVSRLCMDNETAGRQLLANGLCSAGVVINVHSTSACVEHVLHAYAMCVGHRCMHCNTYELAMGTH